MKILDVITAPAELIFRGVVGARNLAYDGAWFEQHQLRGAVVSIGNLSVGGTGKTPAVITLGRALLQRGIQFDVLTRGYGRRSNALAIVNPADDAACTGDEPLLIARALGVPVVVDAERYRAGVEAERQFPGRIHLLDDGFQHRALARDFDLVLVDARDLDDRLLPAGRLREPLSALRRADAIAVVATGGEKTHAQRQLASLTSAPVFRASKVPVSQIDLSKAPFFAFCGIARPQSFWHTLEQMGAPIAGYHAFRDHHCYSDRDIRFLKGEARAKGAVSFVTTDKDGVKLRKFFEPDRIQFVSIELEIEGLNTLCELIVSKCNQHLG